MHYVRNIFSGGIRRFGMLIALVALIAIFQIATHGKVLTPTNASNIINGSSYVLIMAMGMVLVIVIGQIDLAVGSVAALVGIVVALSMTDQGVFGIRNLPWWAAIILGLLLGFIIGAWQGFFLAKLGIPGFITTLGGMMLFRGLQTYIGNSQSIPTPSQFWYLGGGSLPDWGPDFGINNSTLLLGIIAAVWLWWSELRKRAKRAKILGHATPLAGTVTKLVLLTLVLAYVTWLFGSGSASGKDGQIHTSLPFTGLLVIILGIFYTILSQRTPFGRHIYAVGGNRLAAPLTGINVPRTYFFTMVNMSVLAALAGMMFIGRSRASGPQDGTGWELDVIASVFVGGAAVYGGIGTVSGSLIGGLVMAVLNNGIQLLGFGADVAKIFKGLVLLAAVTFDVYNKVQGRPSLIGRLFGSRGKRAATEAPASPGETGLSGAVPTA
jgi:putative multiple sugar transport system permease protein